MAAIPVPNKSMVVGSGLWSVGIPPPPPASRSTKVVISVPPITELPPPKRLPNPSEAEPPPPPPPQPISAGTKASHPRILVGFMDFINHVYPLCRYCNILPCAFTRDNDPAGAQDNIYIRPEAHLLDIQKIVSELFLNIGDGF